MLVEPVVVVEVDEVAVEDGVDVMVVETVVTVGANVVDINVNVEVWFAVDEITVDVKAEVDRVDAVVVIVDVSVVVVADVNVVAVVDVEENANVELVAICDNFKIICIQNALSTRVATINPLSLAAKGRPWNDIMAS